MPLVKTYLLPLIAAVILTTACSNETPDEVRRMLTATCPLGAPSPSFKSFFLGNQMPTGLFDGTSKTLRYICQTIPKKPGVYYYSTLFDENTGIAVLSAYTVDAIQAKGIGLIKDRAHSWRVNKGIARQGTNNLYQGSKMDKGHLNPVKINSFDASYVKATFSYTNAVPQYPTWNRGLWANYEGKIADYVKRICAGQNGGIMYLMTGTSKFRLKLGPNNQPIQDAIVTTVYFPKAGNPKTAILQPNSMWTAGCCVWTNKVTGYQEAQSIAVMGNNGPNSRTTSMKLDDLQKILRNKASPKPVDLFPASHACGANSQLLP